MSHEKDTYAGEYALYRHDNEVRAPLEAEIEKLRTRLAAAEEQVATLTEQVGQAWDHCVTVCGPDLAAARRALAEQVSHRAGCCWTWGQGCDCGSVDALLAPERPREERG